MQILAVEIVRFVDERQPGWLEAELVDAAMRRHRFVDKVPIFGFKDLGPEANYPQAGIIRCEILSRYKDAHGVELVRITTLTPDGVESTEGTSEFVVHPSQLLPTSF